MEATERAVQRLTEAHTEMTEAGAVDWPPLLLWLRSRITEINRRGNGSGGQGVPLNSDALDILNYIEGRYRLLCGAAFIAASHDLISGVSKVWDVLKADRQGGRVGDMEWENIEAEFPDWVARIEGEQDRPRKMEVTVPCPRCETRWVVDDLGRQVAAVVVEFSAGRAPLADCRSCGDSWTGWKEVSLLGFTLGADQNLEVLRACGIELEGITRM